MQDVIPEKDPDYEFNEDELEECTDCNKEHPIHDRNIIISTEYIISVVVN